MHHARSLLLVLAVLLGGVVASRAAAARTPPTGRKKGTHFVAELQGGAALFGSGGPAFGALFGGGGRIPGSRPRLYLIGEVAGYGARTAGESAALDLEYIDQRSYLDVAAGLRIYVPLLYGFRAMADAQAGGSRVSARLERSGLPPRSGVGWRPLFQVAVGVQYRIRRWLSLGLRHRILLTNDDLAGLRELVQAEAPHRSLLTASLTWHF